MASLKPVQSVLAFLTILPSGKESHDIHYVAKNMYLFPIAGLVIGAIIGAMAFGISATGLHPLLVGLLVTGALVIITGVHHTDALADFADGLMAKGGKEVKRKAMLDPAVGSAGVAALVMYFAGMIIVFYTGFASGLAILTSIVTAEVIAKYVMVLLANRGLSAWEGFSSPFTAAMKDKRKMTAATGIMLAIVWFSSSYAGLAALGVSLAIVELMKYVSGKSFGGISGDVLGASNEMTRLSSLIVLSSLPAMTIF
ncbi:MAG TPA: adenosylcobinamide-GDP ribazoletransferase [Nitrososphaera sp.]